MKTVSQVPAGTKPPIAATYAVAFTAAQIFGFADLVRRLGQVYGPDADRSLRQDLVDALNAFVNLLPEPSEQDGDAYLAAVRTGELPDWAPMASRWPRRARSAPPGSEPGRQCRGPQRVRKPPPARSLAFLSPSARRGRGWRGSSPTPRPRPTPH